nr:cytochrome P450 93A3-like [Ipomoea batatas]
MAEFQEFIFPLLSCLILTILLGILFRKQTNSRLPPSPLAFPIIGHLHLLAPIPHQALHNLSNRHGPLMQIWLGSVPCVVASSAEMAKEFLKTHEYSFSDRPISAAVDYLTYGSQDFSFAPYGPYWKFMKKLCMSELLGGRTLDLLLPVRRDEIRRFLALLSHKAKAGEHVDVGAELLRGLRKRLKDVHERFDGMMEKIIHDHIDAKRRRQQNKGGDEVVRDLLDILLDIAEDKSSEMQLTRENIKAFALDIFAAGTDTSAITVEWALAELINHPETMEKASQELDSVIGTNRLVQESDISNLPYLQAIVKETLRLHPTGPMIVRESTEDCVIGGYNIPAKTRLFVNVWGINRDPRHWENPLEFQPERFLSGEFDVRGQHYEFLPFGSGRRGCPGTSLAMQVVQTSLAAMIQCFKWKVNEGSVDMEEGPGLTLPRAHPLVCLPVARINPLPSM